MQTSNPDTIENIDTAEIAKFEALALRWWDKTGEFKPLHDINPLRTGFIDSVVNVAEKKVIDIGCGGGILSEALAQRGAIVDAIDMGFAPLSVAKLHMQESNLSIKYEQKTAEAAAEQSPQNYDVVTCLEMLEHVPDPESVIQACATLLKPGGHVFFSTINRNPKAWLFAVVGAEYILKMLPKGTHEYEKFIRPSELALWMRNAGLICQKMVGMSYNPLTKNYFLADDVSVNYLVHAYKPD